jgi:hypothetical protein
VRILEGFRQQNYIGDALHPTDERLKQAVTACLPESDDERIAIETDLLRKGRAKPEGVTEKVN